MPALVWAAEKPEPRVQVLTQQGAWTAFQVSEPQKYCYIAGTLKDKNARPGVRLIVTVKSDGSKGEINYISALALKEGAIKMGKKSYPLLCDKDAAWLKDTAHESALIDLFRREKECLLSVEDAAGKKVQDFFPLNGFAKAYDAAYKACFPDDLDRKKPSGQKKKK